MKNRKKNYISRLSSSPKAFVKIENVEIDVVCSREKEFSSFSSVPTCTSTIKKLLLPLQNTTNLSSTANLTNVTAKPDSNKIELIDTKGKKFLFLFLKKLFQGDFKRILTPQTFFIRN